MADYHALQAVIDAYIKQNGVQAITGPVLNGILTAMVNALGKGYTVAGEATPSTDPGTMTGPVAYIAHTAGTYTHFGNLVVNDGEVAMLIYNEQTWTKEVMASLAATATIDGNVGTPAVGVSFVNGVLSFDFSNMKGETGDAAGFGTVVATVDANIGTPGVNVVTSGPDTAKNMTFQFTNLKGETGVTSVVVTVDNNTGTPGCTASVSGGVLTLAFTNLKGAQGDTGVSADYPITIANNLTTNDPTNALSAAMGVQLESEISQLEHDVDGLEEDVSIINGFYIDEVEEDATSFDLINYYITNQGKWSTNSGYKHCEIPIMPGTPVRVTAPAGESAFVSFLKTNTRTSGGDVDVCSSLVGTWRIELVAGETKTLVAPSDANYFYFYRGLGAQSYPYTPSEIVFILPKIDAEEVNASIEEVVELREDVGNTAFPSVTQDCSNTTWVSGNILAVSGSSMGSTSASTANSHTDYIELEGIGAFSRVLRYTRGNTTNSSSNSGLVFYDANKDALGFQKMVVDAPAMGYSMENLPVPANAKYFRTTIRNEDVTNFSATLTITTKVYTSGIGKDVEDLRSDVDYLMGLAPGEYKPYNVVGSPIPFIPTIDTTGLSVFNNLTDLYNAFDALVTAFPDWFKKEANIGMDASNTYEIRHYTLRFQHPLITNDRAGDGTNLWDDTKYKYRRIIVNMGIHATEKYSVLGGYLAIKGILESNEPWAKFIKDNFVIDVVPSSNPWGLMNNSSQNANGYNLNRTFFENVQAENTAIIDLIADLKPKGLVGVIDLHNTGLGDGGGNSYFVAKPTYKFWDYYAVLVQQLQALLYDFTETMFGNDRDNHFHLWDGSENSGQLHQYADSQGLLGGTVEVSSGQGITGSFLTIAQVVNIINAFGTFTNV